MGKIRVICYIMISINTHSFVLIVNKINQNHYINHVEIYKNS